MIRILRSHEAAREEILSRGEARVPESVERDVREILAAVRARGDAAVMALNEKFGAPRQTALLATPEEIEEGYAAVDEGLKGVLARAKENIEAFHRRQKREGFIASEREGIVLGQRILPIARAGLYVPGGTASYPSTVLMNAIPAKIAGVPTIVMATPPGPDGKIAPAILAAAKIAGVTTIVKAGGAQAIAALAYGTQSVPKVDKIVGPGNIYVATAKRQVYGQVDIDMIAGPSEILVVADAEANPAHVAADLLSQAEHDRLSSAVLVCDSMALAEAVAAEIERQLALLPREEIARASIEKNGKIIVADDLREGVAIANELAPEHLELCVCDPFALLGAVKNAGSIFLGRYAPEALGDYFAGPNHTLPTLGTARFASPLSVDDFVKKSSYIYYSREAFAAVKDDVARFARAEGLEAHARSALSRFEEENA
ncbi:MAG TPA: histidinol dehydrogenase [Candidatus Alectryocaccomicrobium excrementavium]|uniref:Histidinol dehydrogenase n=1 Tax=Candidatus Alectryocaccomicrobium excrementavium TaxID=2840668 RepID=A0A9D1G206_9FIRM|nr:histidinol dehydrogenase [Candidatus Alectryocaccomicrobium excrementavium]